MKYVDLPWSYGWFGIGRCKARLKSVDSADYFGRCELKRHWGNVPHALERGMVWVRWETVSYLTQAGTDLSCDCSVHDVTTPGAAHAVDCPMYD